MRVYISGPMRGHTRDDVQRRFNNAEAWCRRNGRKVFNPSRWYWLMRHLPYKWCLAIDILMMCFCDEIYLLDGWRDSGGARIEHDFAELIGMRLRYE